MLLIIDSPTDKNPLLFDLYQYLIDNYDARLSVRINTPVQDIVLEDLDGVIPDMIYQGFSLGQSLGLSSEYINKNDIPVAVSVGDPIMFTTKVYYTRHLWRIKTVKYIVCPWPGTVDNPFDRMILDFKDRGWTPVDLDFQRFGNNPKTFLKDAELIHVPWGVNTDEWPDLIPNRTQTIDVSFLCMVAQGYDKHDNRREILKILSKIRGINKMTGQCFGRYYNNILLRSKVFIVVSGSKFLTQKYLEGAMSGCLIMGDVPIEGTNTFVHGETMIGLDDYGELEYYLEYFLNRPREIQDMTRECLRRVKENYNISCVTTDLVEALF